MKEIHSGLVLDVAPSTGGFVFAAQQDSTEDGRAIVEYKTCDFVSRKLENITRNLYLLTKFGDLYERYADHPQQYLTSMTAFFPNGDLLLVEADGSARRLTQQGHCVYEGQFLYHGDAPSAVAVANGFVWASYSHPGAVLRYDPRTMREAFRYGGGSSAALLGAHGLWFEGDILFVCCKDSGRIVQINLRNFHMEDHHLFTEPVNAFMKVQATEIVWLNSGIYKF